MACLPDATIERVTRAVDLSFDRFNNGAVDTDSALSDQPMRLTDKWLKA